MSPHLDENLLISSVKAHECIWNTACKDFRNRELKHAEWNAVAREVGCSRHECERKWKSLKSVFTENFKKYWQHANAPLGTLPPVDIKWVHFAEMMFLRDVVLSRQTDGNVALRPDELVDTDQELDNSLSRKREKLDQDFIEALKQEDDSEMLFLKSLAPSLRQVPDYFKEDAKIEILQVIAKYKKMQAHASEFM